METKARELSDINSDGPELSCPYIDGVIKRFPETKNTLEYVREINAQLRHDRDGYAERVKELQKRVEELELATASRECPSCGEHGDKVSSAYSEAGVTVTAEYYVCKPCDIRWVSGRQQGELNQRIINNLKEVNKKLRDALKVQPCDCYQIESDHEICQRCEALGEVEK